MEGVIFRDKDKDTGPALFSPLERHGRLSQGKAEASTGFIACVLSYSYHNAAKGPYRTKREIVRACLGQPLAPKARCTAAWRHTRKASTTAASTSIAVFFDDPSLNHCSFSSSLLWYVRTSKLGGVCSLTEAEQVDNATVTRESSCIMGSVTVARVEGGGHRRKRKLVNTRGM